MTAILKCENVSKEYRNFSLKDITFTRETGYLSGIIGLNGAGKTTLLRILAGIDSKFEGTVTLDGTDIRENPKKIKQQIGLVAEELAYFMDKTPYENGELLGIYYDNWSMERYFEWMDIMKIPQSKCLYELSKGTKMKFQICFAMAHQPKFLFMDEPTAGFDPVFRKDFLRILQTILKQDTGIIMSTHITSDLDHIADYILVLDRGKLVANDTKDALEDQKKRAEIQNRLTGRFQISDLLEKYGEEKKHAIL